MSDETRASSSDAADLAIVLEHLRAHGLVGRATSVRVGSVEILMLPAPIEAAESDGRRERRAEQDHHETLFGSA